MKSQASAALMAIVLVAAVGGSSTRAEGAGAQPAWTRVQYDRYPDQRPDAYYPQDRYYPGVRRDGYYPPYPPPRDAYDRNAPLWRPGDVLPGELLDFIVDDWEPRGLERPPDGHLWVRVGYQFILVRERDLMISRVINFD